MFDWFTVVPCKPNSGWFAKSYLQYCLDSTGGEANESLSIQDPLFYYARYRALRRPESFIMQQSVYLSHYIAS
jgi:hypothetical protein